MTQWANGSRSTGAAAMRARTCASTLENMLRHAFERAGLSRCRADLRRVPAESQGAEIFADLAMLGELRVELDDQGAHARIAQGIFHPAYDLVLEAVDVDLHVARDRHLSRRHQVVEAQRDRALRKCGGPRFQAESDFGAQRMAGAAGHRLREIQAFDAGLVRKPRAHGEHALAETVQAEILVEQRVILALRL